MMNTMKRCNNIIFIVVDIPVISVDLLGHCYVAMLQIDEQDCTTVFLDFCINVMKWLDWSSI